MASTEASDYDGSSENMSETSSPGRPSPPTPPNSSQIDNQVITLEDLGPNGRLSQTSISLESYILGILLGAGLSFATYALFALSSPLWRPPLFLAILSAFHFTEFYTYARWNLKNTKADSFLTLSNGRAYTIAMTLGFVESVVTSIYFQKWQSIWAQPWIQAIGLIILIVAQYVRHGAIATAGTSFNHHVQKKKKTDHVLVTWGLYSWFRHPSYFGFFWWAVGGQVLLGNAISTLAFSVILWRFFWFRTSGEFPNLPEHREIMC
jgi:protein-S-isoprenylcysteine O-methyltransferase